MKLPRHMISAPMAAPPLDLAEFRLLQALRASPAGPVFTQLWNAQAGAAWSVFRALVDGDDQAIGWMASFRLDLAERAASFRVDEGVAPQVGRALYGHAHPAFLAPGLLPTAALSPDEIGIRALPPSARLAYLVDLFFDWTPPDPAVAGAYRLLEPAGDTNARLLVHTALLRNPPAEALILPPGVAPLRDPSIGVRAHWPWLLGAFLAAALAAVSAYW